MLKEITSLNHLTIATSNLPNEPLMTRMLMNLMCPLNLIQPEGVGVPKGVDVAEDMGLC